jgi:intracellular multiplication protein IcmO
MFYANPKPAKRMQVNQYLCVEKPAESTLINLDKRIRRFAQVFNAPQFMMEQPAANEDINTVAAATQTYSTLKPFERSIAAVIAILEKEVDKQRKVREEIEAEQSQEFANEVHAFTPVHVPDFAVEIIGEEDLKRFSNPLLLRGRTREALTHIERLCGRPEAEAAKVAENIINDIIKATYYPPKDVLHKDIEGALDAIEQLYDMFNAYSAGGSKSQGS